MTQDADRDPAASLGSVAGEPVAWAAVYGDGDIAWVGFTPEGAADGAGDRKIIPLYRQPQPALTEAEREAIRWARIFLSDLDGLSPDATAKADMAYAVLAELLERTK